MDKKIFIGILNVALISSLSLYVLGIFGLQPNGYQFDIYSQLGFNILLGYIFSFISAMLLYTLVDKPKKYLYLFLVFAIYFGIIISPYLLGYYLSDRGDSLGSIGYVRTILQTGKTDPLDIYPVYWILLAIVSILSNIPVSEITLLSTILNNFIFILAMLLFVKRFNSKLLLYFTPAFLLTYYHGTTIAQFFAYALNLLVLYLLLVHTLDNMGYGGKGTNALPILILMITLIFSHPFVAFFNLGILLVFALFPRVHPKGFIEKNNTCNKILRIYILVLAGWVSWQQMLMQNLVYIPEFAKNIFIVKQVLYATSIPEVSFFELLKYFVIRFWSQILIYLTALAMALIYFFTYKGKQKLIEKISNHMIEILVASWSIIFTIILLLLKHGYDRVFGLNFMIFGSIAVISALDQKLKASKWHKILIFCLIISMPFSVFGAFYSPVNGMPYTGVTFGELAGVMFSFSHLDQNQKLIDPIGEAKRWSMWLYGYSETFRRGEVLYLYKLPDHFGYGNVTCFSKNEYIERIEHNIFGYKELHKYYYPELLVIVPDYAIEMYEKVPLFNKVARFRYTDEMMLRADHSVNSIYYGSNLRVYKPIPCDNN